ncbi:hypothetical protein [Flavobacterium limi]|uniref:Lipoprotein n=1 Tax=Flavobacterium limi TaxID=2045105 RepID=A0ABQ1UY57_9FLAO|nr:hypothetical protein [Flavobacterium limi]GGF30034.1 hypothetical protein GCM10011518_44090 [Flavobacterium limi]
MKGKITSLIITTSLVLFSCGKENEKTSKEAVAVKKTDGNYVSRKWKKTKDYFIDSDSIKNIRKEKYFKDLKAKYPEYEYAQKWFESNPKELFGLKGDYYKMIKATIEDDGSITYKNLIPVNERGTFEYLFVNDNAYYIYELSFLKNKIRPEGIRRIKKGYGDQPMHDLEFDNNHFLEKENFQGNVDQDLFTKNGHLFFEIAKETNDKKVTQTIDLGVERKF